MNRWYRAYEGTVSDPKLGEVAILAETSRSVAVATWHAILESCAAVNDGGRFDTNPRRVAAILGEPVAVIERVFAAFSEVGITDCSSATAWKRRQFESDRDTTAADRQRRKRERDKATGHATVTAESRVTERDTSVSHATVTAESRPPESETETESSPLTPQEGGSEGEDKIDVADPGETPIRDVSEPFERFWAVYPRRDGDNPKKPAAEKFRNKMVKHGADPEAIIAGARAYADDLAAKGKVGSPYVAQAQTWLNQERWRDYEAAVRPSRPTINVQPGTPQWDAWRKHYAGAGRSILVREMDALSAKGLAFPVQSEWPPGCHAVPPTVDQQTTAATPAAA